MHFDIKQIGDSVISAVKTYVSTAIDSVTARIDDIDSRLKALPTPVNGRDGNDGLSAYEVATTLGFTGTEFEWLLSLQGVGTVGPEGDKGEKGDAGKDADIEVIKSLVVDAVSAIPVPKDGQQGVPGESVIGPQGVKGDPGADGRDGKDVDMDVVKSLIVEAVAAIPKPQDGKSFGIADVRDMLSAEVARWELDFERRASDMMLKLFDRIPVGRDGKDGRDAFELDDLDLKQSDDGRTVTLVFRRGDEVREKSFKLNTVIYRGVFRDGDEYERGDTVTWGGSVWHCNETTKDKPIGGGKTWTLSVKHGQPGKDAVTNAPANRDPVRLR